MICFGFWNSEDVKGKEYYEAVALSPSYVGNINAFTQFIYQMILLHQLDILNLINTKLSIRNNRVHIIETIKLVGGTLYIHFTETIL